MPLTLEPSFAGVAVAALAVAAGAPIFGDGLRALRLRRHLAGLGRRPLAGEPTGFVHTSGRVSLDGPLFSPLSGKACAGFVLELHRPGGTIAASIERRGPFRLVDGKVSARVLAMDTKWRIGETARREIRPGDPLSENLSSLLENCPEMLWLRRQAETIVLVERALLAGEEAHVVGVARQGRPWEMPQEMEMLRTGTDDQALAPAPVRTSGPFGIERRHPGRPFPVETDLWIDRGGHLDFVLVSDRPPAAAALTPPAWRLAGLVLGPSLSLGALLFLARIADQLRAGGRFF